MKTTIEIEAEAVKQMLIIANNEYLIKTIKDAINFIMTEKEEA